MGVLSPVSCNHLILSVITEKGEVHLEHVRAGFNNLQDPVRLLHLILPEQLYWLLRSKKGAALAAEKAALSVEKVALAAEKAALAAEKEANGAKIRSHQCDITTKLDLKTGLSTKTVCYHCTCTDLQLWV